MLCALLLDAAATKMCAPLFVPRAQCARCSLCLELSSAGTQMTREFRNIDCARRNRPEVAVQIREKLRHNCAAVQLILCRILC